MLAPALSICPGFLHAFASHVFTRRNILPPTSAQVGLRGGGVYRALKHAQHCGVAGAGSPSRWQLSGNRQL
jgi:hypothetical protein